ncbi:MAG: hypothetical protein AAGH19_06545 [Pseudomonadota bacterium]
MSMPVNRRLLLPCWLGALGGGALPRIGLLLYALTVFAPLSALAQESVAEASLSPAFESPPWTGQAVTLNLDLKTSSLSFSEVFFNLPEVTGALVLRTDTTTVKLSERRGADTWQVLRYPITLFPQRSGELTVPAFEVRFKTQNGFGTEAMDHRFETSPITLTVRQPPELPPDTVVVTTPRHALKANWTLPDGDLTAGDAVTLTIERQAAGLSAMLLPPVPVAELEGLAAYPSDPVIEDRTNRGALTGVRTDRVTWMIEQPGDYALPAIAFRSWDPVREALNTQTAEGVRFSALPAPGAPKTADATRDDSVPGLAAGTLRVWLAALLATALLAALLWRFRDPLWQRLAGLRTRILPPARALLKALNPGAPP